MIIELLKSKTQWYFRIKSRNGNILAHSETYKNKRDCVKIISKIANTIPSEWRVK
jgi:uncharacterized protein YegP (UPF0339 family)